jgi:hypothetical protein
MSTIQYLILKMGSRKSKRNAQPVRPLKKCLLPSARLCAGHIFCYSLRIIINNKIIIHSRQPLRGNGGAASADCCWCLQLLDSWKRRRGGGRKQNTTTWRHKNGTKQQQPKGKGREGKAYSEEGEKEMEKKEIKVTADGHGRHSLDYGTGNGTRTRLWKPA